jgi:hypothetical protein
MSSQPEGLTPSFEPDKDEDTPEPSWANRIEAFIDRIPEVEELKGCRAGELDDFNAQRYLASGYIETNLKGEIGQPYTPTVSKARW